jgi:EAL domain-containing protein (putative c-di-GMP-specific phosphodiesterase class I)
VCSDIKEKIDNGDTPFPVSVNITKTDFAECDLLNVFEEAEQDSGVPAKYLCLEVSEEVFKDNYDILGVIENLLARGEDITGRAQRYKGVKCGRRSVALRFCRRISYCA